jgi:hypothetical protein
MSSSTARVALRYRPGADVLSGQIHLGEVGDHTLVTDTPDADTSVVWATTVDGSPADHLVHSFHLVFAAARFAEGRLPLPAALQPVVESLITTAHHALHEVDDPLARARATATANTQLPLSQLRRSALPALGTVESPPGHDAAAVSRSLQQVADAVQSRVPVPSADDDTTTDHLARLLRELGSTLHHRPGRTAPGTTAATAAAARATSGLTDHELHQFHDALEQLLAPANWSAADHSLRSLLTSLEQPRR